MANGKSKTVKIRIGVAIDTEGNYGAAAWKGGPDGEMMDMACEQEVSGTHQEYFITIEVPLPKAIELKAAIVEAGEMVTEEEEAA